MGSTRIAVGAEGLHSQARPQYEKFLVEATFPQAARGASYGGHDMEGALATGI